MGFLSSKDLRSHHNAQTNPIQGRPNKETKINLDSTCRHFYQVHPEKKNSYSEGDILIQDLEFLTKVDFLYENRQYLSSFSIKFVFVEEYHCIFDKFEEYIRASLLRDGPPDTSDSGQLSLVLNKLNNFLTYLIDQKQSKFFFYWYKGRFLIEFLLKQRDFGILILTLKVLFKLLKSRNKNPESIRIFFDDLFEPFLGFIFAINCGPLLGQFNTFNSDLLQNPSFEKGHCFLGLIFRGKPVLWAEIHRRRFDPRKFIRV